MKLLMKLQALTINRLGPTCRCNRRRRGLGFAPQSVRLPERNRVLASRISGRHQRRDLGRADSCTELCIQHSGRPWTQLGIIAGAKVQAMTMLDILTHPELVQQAWDYYNNVQTKDMKYKSLLRP